MPGEFRLSQKELLAACGGGACIQARTCGYFCSEIVPAQIDPLKDVLYVSYRRDFGSFSRVPSSELRTRSTFPTSF